LISIDCRLLDEVGLAEESPHLPLKVLHKELEAEALTTLTTQLKQVGADQSKWGINGNGD
jgi:hypothetical protein